MRQKTTASKFTGLYCDKNREKLASAMSLAQKAIECGDPGALAGLLELPEIGPMLLRFCAQDGQTLLAQSARLSQGRCAKALLAAGADPALAEPADYCSGYDRGILPAALALKAGDPGLARDLMPPDPAGCPFLPQDILWALSFQARKHGWAGALPALAQTGFPAPALFDPNAQSQWLCAGADLAKTAAPGPDEDALCGLFETALLSRGPDDKGLADAIFSVNIGSQCAGCGRKLALRLIGCAPGPSRPALAREMAKMAFYNSNPDALEACIETLSAHGLGADLNFLAAGNPPDVRLRPGQAPAPAGAQSLCASLAAPLLDRPSLAKAAQSCALLGLPHALRALLDAGADPLPAWDLLRSQASDLRSRLGEAERATICACLPVLAARLPDPLGDKTCQQAARASQELLRGYCRESPDPAAARAQTEMEMLGCAAAFAAREKKPSL